MKDEKLNKIKKAKAILLTDYNLQISLQHYEIYAIDPDSPVNEFTISGEDISMILDAAGIDVRFIKIPEHLKKKRSHQSLDSMDFSFGQEIKSYELPEDCRITQIDVEVVAPFLVNITIHSESDTDTDKHTEEITYSGHFLVEWLSLDSDEEK
jgi:hypothetical protein